MVQENSRKWHFRRFRIWFFILLICLQSCFLGGRLLNLFIYFISSKWNSPIYRFYAYIRGPSMASKSSRRGPLAARNGAFREIVFRANNVLFSFRPLLHHRRRQLGQGLRREKEARNLHQSKKLPRLDRLDAAENALCLNAPVNAAKTHVSMQQH